MEKRTLNETWTIFERLVKIRIIFFYLEIIMEARNLLTSKNSSKRPWENLIYCQAPELSLIYTSKNTICNMLSFSGYQITS